MEYNILQYILFVNILFAMTTAIDLETMHASAEQACRLMKTLANPDRLMLLCQLSQGEMSVGALEAELGILQPTLSQ